MVTEQGAHKINVVWNRLPTGEKHWVRLDYHKHFIKMAFRVKGGAK